MTEVLLLLLALALTLACAVLVAAEFSLTTVGRGDVERAAGAGECGAQGALSTVRRLTLQLSSAQLGVTVVSLVIDLLRRRRSSLAVVRDASGRLTGMVTPDDLPAWFPQPQATRRQ